MEEDKKFELEEFISELGEYKGRHTELITVYVPKGYSLINIAKQLEQEKSTAMNIKSKVTRKNVLDALERLTRHIKLIKKTPENGIALFAGNTSQSEGQAQIEVWSIEPPMPLKARLYRCDQEFVLGPLREMLEVSEVYGLVVIDRNEATLGLLEGKQIRTLQHMTSGVPGKTEKGGQCLSPDTEVIINGENRKLADIEVNDVILGYDFEEKGANETLCINKWNVKKNKIFQIFFNKGKSIIASEDHLFFVYSDNEIIEKPAGKLEKDDKIISQEGKQLDIEKIEIESKQTELIDIETKNHNFIANGIILHNSAARFSRIRDNMAKEFFRRVAENIKTNFWEMKKLKGILVGGPGPTKEDFLKEGQLVTALKNKILAVKDLGYADEQALEMLVEASKDVLAEQEITREKKILEDFFTKLAKQPEKTAYGLESVGKALDIGAVEILILSKKLGKRQIKQLGEKAKNISATVELVSEETEEGQQFKSLGGAGAILRFAI